MEDNKAVEKWFDEIYFGLAKAINRERNLRHEDHSVVINYETMAMMASLLGKRMVSSNDPPRLFGIPVRIDPYMEDGHVRLVREEEVFQHRISEEEWRTLVKEHQEERYDLFRQRSDNTD